MDGNVQSFRILLNDKLVLIYILILNSMKELFIYLLLMILGNTMYAQESIFTKNVNWKNYEKEYDVKEKIIEVNKIKDELLVYLKSNERLNDNLSSFHFIDYDFNGEIDIIYSGNAGTESLRTLIFERRNDGFYYKIFDKFGEVINIIQQDSFIPISLVLRDIECCGSNQIVYEVYHLLKETKSSKFRLSTKYSSFRETELPQIIFSQPKLFEVENEKYYLRLAPYIEVSNKYEEDLHIDGNIVHTYKRMSKGYAIAENTDSTGRVWWFVVMLNNLNLKGTYSEGNSNEIRNYSIGWMSSRYLKILH